MLLSAFECGKGTPFNDGWEFAKIPKVCLEGVATLLAHLDKIRPEMAIMIKFMLETGARLVDCLTLQWSQIKGNKIVWNNKVTKKNEPRPITSTAINLLNKLPKRTDKVFRWSYNTSTRLEKWLKDAFKKCGIEQNGRAYQEFRSTFRMNLLERKVPEIYIEYLMRHSKPEITWEYYTDKSFDTILDIIDPFRINNN